jgi:hypothetical protein
MHFDVYHPLVASDHDASCAALCTDYCNEHDADHGCHSVHHCWCPDGALSFSQFQAKHSDVTVAEAEG